MPGELLQIDGNTGRQEDVDDVLCGVARVGFDLLNVVPGSNQSFGNEKSDCELFIVARSSHGDADRMVVDPDFKRLFRGQVVRSMRKLPVFPTQNFLT